MAEGEQGADLVLEVAGNLGFEARRCHDAGSALEAVEYDPPALVIHGWDLPDMDAVTFHGAVQQRARGVPVPTLAVAPDREAASRLAGRGADHEIVVRPLHREGLARRLEELLEGAGGPTPDVTDRDSAVHEEWARPIVRERSMKQVAEEQAERALPDVRLRVVGLGEWGVAGAELFQRQGIAARGIDTAGVERSALADDRRHRIAVQGDYASASRAMSVDPMVGEAIRADADAELVMVIANLGVGAGSLTATLLARIADIAPRAGRLVVVRLPGTRSGPEERALALVALNGILQGPPSGICLVQDPESSDEPFDHDTPLHRLLDLWARSTGLGPEPVRAVSPAVLNRLLATPGFLGWRESPLGPDAVANGRNWHELLAPVRWQPHGFSWADAQGILPMGTLPWAWLEGNSRGQLERFVQAVFPVGKLPEGGGRTHFDRFVQTSWDEAAPCTLVPALYAGDAASAVLVSVGMPYPQGILSLRDSVEADRARLTEKRRKAETLIPLGEDFMPNGMGMSTGPSFSPLLETPHWEPRPEHRPRPAPEPRPEPRPQYRPQPAPEPRPEPLPEPGPQHRPQPAPEPRPEYRPEPEIRSAPEPRVEPAKGAQAWPPEPERASRHEPWPRPERPSRHEPWPRPEERARPAIERRPEPEIRIEPERRPEPEIRVEPEVREQRELVIEPTYHVESERRAEPELPEPEPVRPAPEPDIDEIDVRIRAAAAAVAEAPAKAVEPEPSRRDAGARGRSRSRAAAAVAPAEEPAPETPMPAAYETGLALVQRVFTARDLRAEVDLGEVRYALYDLLEVLREDPGAILPEVFRPRLPDWFERHHVNVAVLAILTGDLMKGSLSEVVDLGTAALLHDIGMLENREVWDVDMKLPPKVFEQAIRSHPEEGFRRLQDVAGMTSSIDRIVLEEHERMDGTGYPEGLAGDAIHPGARILAVCDSLEALTHPRPFRDHLSIVDALERVRILAQYTLDPAVVDALSGGLTELLELGAPEAEPR